MKQAIQALLAIPSLLLTENIFAAGISDANSRKERRPLIVVTSVDHVSSNGKPTGLWLEEFAPPYYLCREAGVEVTVASPKGGTAPIDPKSTLPGILTVATKEFLADS